MNKYIKKINEMDGGAPSMDAGDSAGYNTLDSVDGMGSPHMPMNGPTYAGFYDSSKQGSGDTFNAKQNTKQKNICARLKNKISKNHNKIIKNYYDFLKNHNKK